MTPDTAAWDPVTTQTAVKWMRRTRPTATETFGQRLLRLAEALGVTVDELMGVRPVEEETPARRNTRLWRKLRDIEKLPPGDRKAVLKFVEALLGRQKVAGGAR